MLTSRTCFVAVPALVAISCCIVSASDIDEFKVKRQKVFEFTEKPKVSRDATNQPDRFVITFASRGPCDATVVIEDADGRIVRHLASGVLGSNAPAPFQKDSLAQRIVWDGKNDRGQVTENLRGLVARVSLGLRPRFERTLFHSPHKLFGRNSPIVAAAPEGVYVYEGDNVDSIKLFDHDGNYIRTVYPFPADKIGQVKGLRWRQASQDGTKVPLKEGFYQSTFLDSGYNSGFDASTGYGRTHFPSIGKYWAEDAPNFPAATAFAVNGNRVALAGVLGINRVATDGTSGGMELSGPRSILHGSGRAPPEAQRLGPRSAAFSPDGQWLYLTGYSWPDDSKFSDMYGGGRRWLHGVLRVRFADQTAPEAFVGTTRPDGESGTGPDQLNSPASVACDAQGDVYVADCGNSRVQVFTADGKLKESIPVERPTDIAIHPKSGELYVFAWPLRVWAPMQNVKSTLTRFGPPGQRGIIASYGLPLTERSASRYGDRMAGGLQFRAGLDPWAEPAAVWLVPGGSVMLTAGNEAHINNVSWSRGAIKVLAIDGDKLTLRRNFGEETLKATASDATVSNARQLLTFNHTTGKLIVLESRVSANQAVEIDPETGKERLLELPHATDDICFDAAGHMYLNAGSCVTRFSLDGPREVPWDYGEERPSVGAGGHGERSVNAVSALILPGTRPPSDEKSFTCGLCMSPRGMLAVHCWNGEAFASTQDVRHERTIGEVGRKYVPRVFPGRQRWGEIHVWDSHGKVRYEDAVPGLAFLDGVAIDRDDNLYVMAGPAHSPNGQNVLNPRTCTLIKFRPGAGKVITAGDRMVPVPLKPGESPNGLSQLAGATQSRAWVEGAEWMYGGVGYCGEEWCSRFALDLYARSFVPETDRFTVAVLDTNGNLITRLGKYGNIDDGRPILRPDGPAGTRSIGDDEVALMHACYVGVQSDRRLFISDAGNRRIVSVRLDYHVSERVGLD